MVDVGNEGEASAGLAGAMARARPDDTAGELLARASVAGALFGAEAATGPGRFRILDRLGAGGMGTVYAAYDPTLDRGVALKLVQVTVGGRESALAEAKALARLSHPNVVPIFDVGVADDRVYLVMELVRGQTLRRWARGRRRRDVLDAYQQAGAALVAAHGAGLVHRDFKPDNAILGGDGRVRVVDFGLACEAEQPDRGGPRSSQIVGTPRYMAPEQARGAAVTPAADQYSFCVALDEALAEALDPPVPHWLASVLERGRAADPAARFPSMGSLLKALARDPARAWRRRGGVSLLAAGIAALAFAFGRTNADTAAAEVCAGAEDELARAFRPDALASALVRLDDLGAYGRAVRAIVGPQLDGHARRWIGGRRAACLDHRRGMQSDTLFDLRTTCLARSLAAWATVGEILEAADASKLAEIPRAVQALPDPAACADVAALVSGVAPPATAMAPRAAALAGRIAEVRVKLAAGRIEDARAAAARTVAEGRALGYAPLLAEALLVEGHVTMKAKMEAATPILAEAQELAISAGADALAVEAWARRAFAQGITTDPARALDGQDVIEALAKRTGSAFARALLYNNIGSVELARDRRERARSAFETALLLASRVTGPGALELVNARANLALVTDDRGRADELLREAASFLAQRLGDEHPDTLDVRWLRAGTIDAAPAAIAALEPVCLAYELHPGLERKIATCWREIGFVALELEDRARALAAFERIAHRWPGGGRRHDAAYAALARGDARSAVELFHSAFAAFQRDHLGRWWDHLRNGELRLGLGRAQRALGALSDARREFEASIADLEGVVRNHASADYERRLRRARTELALTLEALAAPRPRRPPTP
jgi:predicted Ser/Thr protein kinase